MKFQVVLVMLLMVLMGFNNRASAVDTLVVPEAIPGPFFSVAEHAEILPDHLYTINYWDLLPPGTDSFDFEPIGYAVQNLGFTSSAYWVRFELHHDSHIEREYFLEVARPITNRADLYLTDSQGLTIQKLAGDELPWSSRLVDNRKLLFPIKLQPEQSYHFLLHLTSDGEVITLPIRLWQKDAFIAHNGRENYFFGIYYGLLLLVVILYLFFYSMLRESAYLNYSLYVASMFLLQFSLDGLGIQFLWPEAVWWANHSILVFSSLAVIFALAFVRCFLQLKRKMKGAFLLFEAMIVLGLLILVLSLSPQPIYEFAFPVVNAVSFATTLVILGTILAFYRQKRKVNPFFTAAFVTLLLSAIFFILGNFNVVYHAFFTEHALKIGSGIEVVLLSLSMAGRYRDVQREKEQAQAEVVEQLREKEKLQDEINERLEREVAERTEELNLSNLELAARNKDITDSIHYAKRIQQAILPATETVERLLPGAMIFYRPKDIVSGDFYWLEESPLDQKVLFAAADCTGHGVPGAFMSIVGHNGLQRALIEKQLTQPAQVLDFLHESVSTTLMQEGQSSSGDTVKDGMDIALCSWHAESRTLEYAGAYNPLYRIRNGELEEIKANKQPIGLAGPTNTPYTNHSLTLEPGDRIFIFSDGFADQFGGPKGKKYMYKRFKLFLISIAEQTPAAQLELLRKEFLEWKGSEEQLDDVCVIGFGI